MEPRGFSRVEGKESMWSPCVEYCYKRFGKEYSEECIRNCDYAIIAHKYNELCKIINNSPSTISKSKLITYIADKYNHDFE